MPRGATHAEALTSLAETLLGIEDVDASITAILLETSTLLEADGVSLALHDEDSEELVFFASQGRAALAEFRIPAGAGIAGWTLRTGDTVLSNDPSSDHRFNNEVDRASGFETRALLCVPLIHEERRIGVAQALRVTAGRPFVPGDLDLFERVGRMAARQVVRSQHYRAQRSVAMALQQDVDTRYALVGGTSPAMAEPIALSQRVAETRSTVLLLGESGVGKEVFARAIHAWSLRRDKPFVAVNCVALSPQLLESELFGHERGAFTGATSARAGRFELAQGGTIFLDEIGDLASDLQTKLLRVLQEREIQRVGGSRSIRTDVRVIAATNRDLRRAMREGTFREDLYYRLNVIAVNLPPLRQRRDDIPALVEHFVARSSADLGRRPVDVSRAAMELLVRHDWPGNVRELANAIERAVVLCRGSELLSVDLPPEVRGTAPPEVRGTAPPEVCGTAPPEVRGTAPPEVRGTTPEDAASSGAAQPVDLPFTHLPLSEAVQAFRMEMVRRALDAAGGNQARAARRLGIAPSNLSRLLRQWADTGAS